MALLDTAPVLLFESSKKKRKSKQQSALYLEAVEPYTKNQERVFDLYEKDHNLLLYGCAGTGKTFLSMYLALEELLNTNSCYQKIVIVRSLVPTRNCGFLPGNIIEKGNIYERPYQDLCTELFRRGDAYDILKKKGLIEFTTTSFLRGTTFRDAIVLVDEYQNETLHEFSSIITRVGDNCRLIICGDTEQSDLTKAEKSDSMLVDKILHEIRTIRSVKFGVDDIVRSGIVREWILAKERVLEGSSKIRTGY